MEEGHAARRGKGRWGNLARCGMVGWYDPRQLARTAGEVFVSTIIGKHADHRLIEALFNPSKDGTDCTAPDGRGQDGAFWIDYVADTGDGWDSTYGVAFHLSQPSLALETPDGIRHETRRGSILILGGDEVYPTPNREGYELRTVRAYETALPWTDPPHPRVFAIPGNHDWYDSLVAFTRLYCSGRWFGGWKTQQPRSYFALKLPHDWWLLGTDVQLGSDIDCPQVEYFCEIASRMSKESRIILCNAEPEWIYQAVYGRDVIGAGSNLSFLENHVLKRHVAVFLAGDLHHYRRHEAPNGTQKISAGGGGAFLHPTHGLDVSILPETVASGIMTPAFALKASFPDQNTSRRLAWRNLAFPFLNPWFGIVPATLYLLTAWSAKASIGSLGLSAWGQALETTLGAIVNGPFAVFWVLVIFLGFFLFTDTRSKPYRVIAGPIHALAHLSAVFLLGWAATYLGVSVCGLEFGSIRQLLLAGTVVALGGYFAGSWILGLYLLISLNGFRRHSNEAFSSLRIRDWKCFLRLRIDAQGELTLFPIGIRRVPRRWKPSPGGGTSDLSPDDPRATPPHLIEEPIRVRRHRTANPAPK